MQMPQEDLRKAQLLMLKILKEVHRVCEENNIKYFLSDGTLIGAVRHNGFIPWDDDVDIGMLREEYEKFCKIAPEKLGDEFFFQTIETDPGYGFQFGKVLLRGTKWIDPISIHSNKVCGGMYLDIFPYDKICKNKIKQKLHYLKYRFVIGIIFVKQNYKFADKLSFSLKFKRLIKSIVASILPLKLFIKWREKICRSYENHRTEDILVTKYGGNFYKNQNELLSLKELILHKFEDEQFYIPRDYDIVLRNLYGDYMILPPEEKRQGHGILEYDFGTYDNDVMKEVSQ